MADRSARGGSGAKPRRNGNPVSRTAQIAERRRRRGRRLRLLVVAGILVVLGLAAGYRFWLRDSSLVAIRDLTIRGIDPRDEQQKPVEEAVRLAVGQMTTLDPQPDRLDRELSRFPRVADARMETSFPRAATVTLSMRRDGSRMGSGGDEKLIATDGTVLGAAGDRGADLPEIRGGEPPAEGRLEGRDLAQALVLGGVPGKLRPYVRSSRFGEGGVEVTLSNGLVLAFGEPVQIAQKWRAAAAVIADPNLTDAVYVDLAVPRRPAVRGPEVLPPAGDPAATESPDAVPSG